MEDSGKLQTLATSPKGKEPLVPIGRKKGGPQSGLNTMENRKIVPPLGHKIWPLAHPACNQLLYRLYYIGSYSLTH
jgi:hypothetical protein